MAEHHHHHPQKALTFAFWLNVIFSVIEVVGAIYTNSTAILSDAIHDMGDSIAIGLGIVFEKIATKNPDERYTYGYKRFSLVSALLLSVLLIGGAVTMIVKSVISFMDVKTVNSEGMFALAVLGIVVNGFAFLRLKRSGKQGNNSRAIMLHFLEDVLGWIAVLAGSILIYFTGWYWIDGVLSIGIALFIGWNATLNLIETIPVFLQAAPRDIQIAELKESLLNIEGVSAVVELHVWLLDEEQPIGSAKIIINQLAESQRLLNAVQSVFKQFNVHRTTVQIENTIT
jgi:cobalt-zinc-cadmium efflux system protein